MSSTTPNEMPPSSFHVSPVTPAASNTPKSPVIGDYSLTQHPQSPQPTPQLRRSYREPKTPSHLKYYIISIPKLTSDLNTTGQTSFSTLFSHNNHIAPDVLIHAGQTLVRNVFHDSEPTLYEEATINPTWQSTITQELEALYANYTWDLVPLPVGKKAIGYKWV